MTLVHALLAVTVEHLGPEADEYDLAAYRVALSKAWPKDRVELSDLECAALQERVFNEGAWVRKRKVSP